MAVLLGMLECLDVWNLQHILFAFPDSTLPPELAGQKIFLSSIHWNNEDIIKSHWSAAILALVEEIGIDNVYVSIYESGS